MPPGRRIPGTATISVCRSWVTTAAPKSMRGTTPKREPFASLARSTASRRSPSLACWSGTATGRSSSNSSRACSTGHRCPPREKKGWTGFASSRRSTARLSWERKSRWRRRERTHLPQRIGSGGVNQIRVTVWNEYRHEREDERYRSVYPNGIHGAIADGLVASADLTVRTATLDEPENGLPEDVLMDTDVLIWWGHKAHEEVSDETVNRVQARVLHGMGLVVLHSGHFSKVFKRLMGTSCNLIWRVADEVERVWVVAPSHPIAAGLDRYIELEQEEMYGEFFDVPPPDELVFLSWFPGGEVFRSGCCYTRGSGKIFYFRPGHESYPTFYNPDVRKVIDNAVRWAAPVDGPARVFGNQAPLSPR